jgi:hypothetical protein
MKPFFATACMALFLMLFSVAVNAQVRIGGTGTSVHPSAVLQLESNDKGLLLPRIADTTAINALNPPDGMLIFLTTDNSTRIRTNGRWEKLLAESRTTLTTATDYTNNSNLVANATAVPDLSFTAQANKEYLIEAYLLVQSANINNGIRMTLSGPATGIQFAAIEIMVPSNQTSQTVANLSTFNTYVQGTRMPAVGQSFLARIHAVVKMGATAASLGIRFYSETNGTAVTVKSGSVLQYRIL